MSRGQHAADDGSFQRSAGGAMARGIALIVAAIVLGVVLLNATDDPAPFVPKVVADDGATTSTTAKSGDSTSSSTSTTAAAKAHKPAEVTVFVVNGSGVKGAASRIGTTLGAAGYKLKPAGNTATAEASNVYYQPGYEADARAIAGLLTPAAPGVVPMPNPAPVKDLGGANILVVVAADLAGR